MIDHHKPLLLPSDAHEWPDESWWSLAAGHPVGSLIEVSTNHKFTRCRLGSLGFALQGGRTYRREVNLDERLTLVEANCASLPRLGAVAIVSIDRRTKERPYLYSTLESTFAALPAGVEINVLVGNDDDEYVRPESLAAEIGAELANRVHVHPTSPAAASFLRARHDNKSRATYNHARALRNMSGSGHLLFVEDDIEWSASVKVRWKEFFLLAHLSAVALYHGHDVNPFCCLQDPCRQTSMHFVQFGPPYQFGFACTQAMIYRADFAESAGRHLALRLGHMPADLLVGQYLIGTHSRLGYARPAVAQHLGNTGGLSTFHQALCFVP